MGRNLFAPQGQTAPATDASQPQAQPRKGRNLLADPNADFDARTAGMSHEQIVEEYRKADINSPYYNYLVKRIEAPQQGETPEQAAVRAGGQQPDGAPAPWKSGVAGAADSLTFGFDDEMGAGIDWLRGDEWGKSLDKRRGYKQQLEEANPNAYLGGQIAGVVPQIVATLGASAPLTAGGRLAANMGYGALQSAIYGFGSGDTMEDRVGQAAEGAAWGAGLGLIPSIGEGIYKGGKALINKTVKNVQKITNPTVAAEKDLVERMVADRKAQLKLEERAARRGKPGPQRRFLTGDDVMEAEARGQRTMVSDLGGDVTRDRLKAASNVSPDASTEMRGAAAVRQVDQGQRVTETVGDAYGDLNPKSVRDDLAERARVENDAAYKAAETNPNAQHLWNPVLQRALSTSWGKQALKNAITKSRNKALRAGEEIVEPIFEEGPDGLMQFTGKLRLPTGEVVDDIQGVGMSLRFWDSVKRSMQDDIDGLLDAGRREDAADLISIKNEMVSSLDQAVPEYKTARTTARDFFGQKDAHEAGAAYFKNMGAFDIAEARAALQAMKPAERELFGRGYAAELVTQISKMGNAEDVNKLFKSPQARMRMRDALGDDVADQLEAFTHREMVQGLLGKHLASGSSTALQAYAMEGLKQGAAGGAGWYLSGDPTGAIPGVLAGMAMRGGYRFTQRKVLDRYARAMAELATSEDPDTIARILSKVSKDSGYMDFSRAVSSGASAAGRGTGNAPFEINIPGGGLPGGAERIEPRMPFAGGGLVEKAVKAIVGRSTVKHPVRKAFPGIYKNPRALVDEVRTEVEDPALKQLFGVTRDDLFEMSKRKGTVKDPLGLEGKVSRPSEAVLNIQTPRNAQRLLDALGEARGREDLWKGMHGWYVMDPAYQYLVKEYGPEEAARLYRRFNTLTGMSSPGSEVITELQRGTAANMMDNLGRFDEFDRYGGIGKESRGADFPPELAAVDGHPYHSTSQAPAMRTYLDKGVVDMQSAKVPTYIASSMPEELGTFTDLPVADAHFTRAVGLPDTRTAEKVFDHAMTPGEYKSVAPWFRDKVASKADLESVPAQAILWGLYGPQTGVTTPVGAPKLELLARGIMATARRLGVSPEVARDLVLTGRAHAYEQGGLVSALGAAAH